MFAGCENIIDINFCNFKTKYITNMKYMFYKCKIKSINLYSFNTINVKYMNNMFESCNCLTKLDISFLDTRNIIDMSSMFKGCSTLISLSDISKWNTEM